MPRFYPNTLFSDSWSSVGNVTFYHRNGMCYWRSKSTLKFAGTASQIRALDVHKRALAAWRGISDDEKELWHRCAEPVMSHRPPFGVDGRISGYNLFVSAYHGFAALGRERVPIPCAWEGFPVFNLRFMNAVKADDGSAAISFNLFLGNGADYSRYRVLCKVQIGTAGVGRNNGKMKNYLSPSMPQSANSTVSINIPADSIAAISSDSLQFHINYLLIDTRTGYRSQQQKISFATALFPAS